MQNYSRIFLFFLATVLLFGYTKQNEDPKKDKLLIEIISYVIERGHYDPKQINDNFSENVYLNYLENLDGQHRFFLKNDIDTFKSHKYKIDDEIKNAQINFFDLTYTKLMQRMNEVENFYEDLLSTPFNFNIREKIDLNYENSPYASNIVELKKIWRKRFKLNALETYSIKKEEELQKKNQDTVYQMISDKELENNARKDIIDNMKNFFEVYNDQKRKDWFAIYINSIVAQFDPHTFYFAPRDKDRFDMTMSGKFEGIGARLNKRNQQIKWADIE